MTTFLLLVVAGVGTGLMGYLTGLASLVSYPALLAAGLSPISANATNTVGVIGVGLGSTARAGSIAMQRGKAALLRQIVIAALGGGVGAALLFWAGEEAFKLIVPWLIGLSSVACFFSPQLRTLRGDGESVWVYGGGLFLISVYGGYFGAGAGVIFLALALIATSESFERAMILKSVLLAVTNIVAAVIFVMMGAVDWLAAIALGLGCFVGGNVGPVVQRRIPEQVLRTVVAVCGIGLAIWLWITR